MGVFDKKYLNDAQIKGFDHYKYNCIDSSPIANYISHPFWNWAVQFYPMWLAPNVITLAGFMMCLGCFFLVSVLDWDLNRNSGPMGVDPLPNGLWLLCAFCTFMAHFLDGTDGKQARRTGASGPTGELFDHGLDSFATVPFTITIFSIFGRHEYSVTPVHLLCVLISVQVVFITTHWEKYNTGVMFLSWGYDVSQYGLALFYLMTFFVGFRWYKFDVFSHYSFATIFECGFYACCAASLVMSVYNMHHAYMVTKTGKQSNLYEGCLPLYSCIILFTVSIIWAIKSPTNLIELEPRTFFWAMGTTFANIACRLIIAQMSSTRAQTLNKLMLIYCSVAVMAIFGLFGRFELWTLRALAIALTLAHIHYGVCVVRQLCGHFKIQALSIGYLQRKQRAQ